MLRSLQKKMQKEFPLRKSLQADIQNIFDIDHNKKNLVVKVLDQIDNHNLEKSEKAHEFCETIAENNKILLASKKLSKLVNDCTKKVDDLELEH